VGDRRVMIEAVLDVRRSVLAGYNPAKLDTVHRQLDAAVQPMKTDRGWQDKAGFPAAGTSS
jgi:hypothetical protein